MGNLAKTGIAAVLAIAFAVILYADTSKMTFAGYLLPRLLAAIIILLSLAMIVETWWCQRKSTDSECAAAEEPINTKRAAVFVGFLLAYIVAISWIGYFIATPAFIVGSFFYLKSMNMKNTVLIAVGFTLFVYLLFVSFLQLPIPLGPME